MARATERQKLRFFQWAREQIEPYQHQRREPKGEVFPGVTAMPLYGHTPGHTGYLISSKGEQLLIWGDIVHIPDIQTRRPDVFMEPDVDGEAAIATRKRIMDRSRPTGCSLPACTCTFRASSTSTAVPAAATSWSRKSGIRRFEMRRPPI